MQDYTDREDTSYTAHLEMSEIHSDTMTDAGVPACELEPVGDCMLSPGDPSPLGRTEDGDLAYPEFPGHTYMRLQRSDCAKLAYMMAKSEGITEMPGPTGDTEILLIQLINEALPDVFYDDTSHGEIARQGDIARLLAGDLKSLERIWKDPTD